MREDTKQRKNASHGFRQATGDDWMRDQLFQVISQGKQALDTTISQIGRMMAETILLMDREERSGPDYRPRDADLQKWASQGGSAFIGDQ